jgi:hypothetical protein
MRTVAPAGDSFPQTHLLNQRHIAVAFKISGNLATYKASTPAKPREYRPLKSAETSFDKRTQLSLAGQMRKGPGGPAVGKHSGEVCARPVEGRHPSTK